MRIFWEWLFYRIPPDSCFFPSTPDCFFPVLGCESAEGYKYMPGDNTNLYSFIQGSLEWLVRELFSADISLYNHYKYIVFNIFSCRIVIISYKMLIVIRVSNAKINKLTMYGILYQNVTIFYRLELASLFQVQGTLKAWQSSKLNFSSSSFIAENRHVKIVCRHVVAISKHDISHLKIMSVF